MAGQTFLQRDTTTQLPKEITATQTSAGAANANQIPALSATGFLDPSLFPAGIGTATVVLPTTEVIASGALIDIWGGAGGTTPSVRNANATDATKPAQGFVNAGVASGANATVNFPGSLITGLTGLTIGASYFLSAATSGAVVAAAAAPAASGNIVQQIGTAVSATSIIFNPDPGIIHA